MTQPAQFKNLVELCSASVDRFPTAKRFGTKDASGQWNWITFRQFGELVDKFRGGLAHLGVGPGDRVAIISNNRIEWAVAAYATYGRGAVFVPMYEKQQRSDWEYIVRDSGAKALIVANTKIAEGVRTFPQEIPDLEHVINLEGDGESDERSYDALIARGAGAPVDALDPDPADTAGLIYTSGTTGRPKGVVLSHRNFTSNVNAVQAIFPMRDGDVSLCFLPWAHSFGQTCELHTLLSFGGASAINGSLETLVDELSEIKPTVFFAVPRLYNKIYDGLKKKVAAGTPTKQKIFALAMDTAVAKKTAEAGGGSAGGWINFKYNLFDKLVYSTVRERLGGQLRYAFSGGAALSKEVAEFLENVGVVIFEGYGLSETSPIATMNTPDHRKVGSVGKAIPEVEIIIDTDAVGNEMGDQGEIVVKGPNVMQGYYNLDSQTADVIREDGSFRTGDLGRLDGDGYLWITGRIKEQYKLENGKYVVPSPLEDQLQLNGNILQAMVYGMNKLNNVAIIVPDFPALAGAGFTGSPEELCKDEGVRAHIRAAIDSQHSEIFKGFERIKDFRLVPEEFSVDNDMLTPKMSLKRRNVIKAYQHLIDEMYV